MTFLIDPRFIRLARIAFWLAFLIAVTLAVLPKPPELPIDRFGDRFAHMFAFSVLAALGSAAFPQTSIWRVAMRLSFLGAILEVVQSIPALHRASDIFDWIADTFAVLMVTAIAGWILKRQKQRQDRQVQSG